MTFKNSLRRIGAPACAAWAVALSLRAHAAPCAIDVAQFQDFSAQPSGDMAATRGRDWRVFIADGRVCAADESHPEDLPAELRPPFTPRVRGVGPTTSKYARVDNGWLRGTNAGEFGGALYWYSLDGRRDYEVSENGHSPLVVDFFPLDNGVGAIEGLEHMGASGGSIVRIERASPQGQWQVRTVVQLPKAPYAVAVKRGGPVFVVLSDSLLAFDGQHGIEPWLTNAPWAGRYPTSAVLSPDERKLYIGMRKFVGEFDLETRRVRMLLPPDVPLSRASSE